jgi:hypothetical protein
MSNPSPSSGTKRWARSVWSPEWPIIKQGWLNKEIESTVRWRRRWFILARSGMREAPVLAYFDDDADTTVPAAVAWALERAELANCKSSRGKWQWRLNLKPEDNSKRSTKWVLSGDSRDETVAWVAALHAAGAHDRFQLSVLDGEHGRLPQAGRASLSLPLQPGAVLQWATKALGNQLPGMHGRHPGVVDEASPPPPAQHGQRVAWDAMPPAASTARERPSRSPPPLNGSTDVQPFDRERSTSRGRSASSRARGTSTGVAAANSQGRRAPPLGSLSQTVFTNSASSALAASLTRSLRRDTLDEDSSPGGEERRAEAGAWRGIQGIRPAARQVGPPCHTHLHQAPRPRPARWCAYHICMRI